LRRPRKPRSRPPGEADVDREELLKRAIVALADSEGIDVPDAEEVAAIESRLDDLDAEVDEKVEDLRERFVELYRDLESKAPADHAHEETAERLDAIAADLDAVADRLDELEAEAAATATVGEAVEETIDALDNRIARVESRTDDIDELDARTEGLDDLEARVNDLEALDARVDDLDEIERSSRGSRARSSEFAGGWRRLSATAPTANASTP